MIATIKNILRPIYRLLQHIIWEAYLSMRKGEDVILCECYIKQCGVTRIKHNNWGDDINKYFFEWITGKSFLMIPFSQFKIKVQAVHYSMIGSIIGFFNLDNTIIYGSGIMNPERPLIGNPSEIISVRGPLTRSALQEHGYECPARYGDPAMLLPLFYKPNKDNHNQIIFIPNMGTADNPIMKDLCHISGGRIVHMTEYNCWTDIIDEIVGSSLVVSESLHGLIVAETYGVPNVWVEFIEHNSWWSFKFKDYYESIGKKDMESIKLYDGYTWKEMLSAAKKWKKADIDYKTMLSYFPFEIKEKFKEARQLMSD